MQKLIDFIIQTLEGSIVLNSFTLVLSILGISSSIYFYYKSIIKKEPIYILRTFSLITNSFNKIPCISIKHDDKEIKDLSITRIAFWNNGKATIDINDIAKKNPLKFIIDKKYEILNAEILYCKNSANDFKIGIDKNEINVSFEYIDHNEGIILQIYHTGRGNDDITIQGNIKSVKRIKRKNNISFWEKPFIYLINKFDYNKVKRFSKYLRGISIILFSLLFPLIYLSSFFPCIRSIVIDNEFSLINFILILALSFLYAKIGMRLLKRPTPSGFEMFYDEI